MIKVIITRQIDSGMSDNYEHAAQAIFQAMIGEHGYISGESLKEVGREEYRVILTHWQTLTDWQRWYASDARRKAVAAVQATLTAPEKVRILINS